MRARTFLTSLLLGMALLFAGSLRADEAGDNASEQSIQKGIAFLLKQQKETGAITENDNNSNAMTALSILALAAAGHQPVDPTPEGQAFRKALDFILLPDRVDPNGYFGRRDGSRMYGHGITTLMLAEMLGMGTDGKMDDTLRERCQNAINVILVAQKNTRDPHAGGWRYEPDSTDADLSVTVWQLMALRAAKNAGMDVPKQAIDEAVAYVKRCYVPDDRNAPVTPASTGGFNYQSTWGRHVSTTAEGLLALQVAGDYTTPEVLGSAEWLLRKGEDLKQSKWFYYGLYYYAQGMYQRGGEYAETGERTVRELLLSRQRPDGSWQGDGEERHPGPIYATSLAILSLGVKNHYLPIYQR